MCAVCKQVVCTNKKGVAELAFYRNNNKACYKGRACGLVDRKYEKEISVRFSWYVHVTIKI
jgi:hypothetical protein